MDENTRALVGIRVEKSQEDLQSAQVLLEHGLFRAAVNRAYYAVFHLASAALLTVGEERSKHSGVQSAFGQFMVKAGHIEAEHYDILKFARKLREESDYRDDLVTLTAEETAALLENARQFVSRVKRYLLDVGALEGKGSS